MRPASNFQKLNLALSKILARTAGLTMYNICEVYNKSKNKLNLVKVQCWD